MSAVTHEHELEHERKNGASSQVPNSKKADLIVKGTPIATAAALACGCAIVAMNDPSEKSILPGCAFYNVTGWYCPGCGMTRALHNFINGDILKAFRFNAMLIIAIPLFVYFYVWWVNWAFTGKRMPTLKLTKVQLWSIVAIALVFVVGRNLPGDIPAFFALDR
jgi:hypothetical protein